MGVLDGIERLINEHGSAVILKERIELANYKYASLETANSRLESENAALRERVRSLEERILLLGGSNLTLKYGVYWDADGNPHCPKCKTPTSQVKWATHENRQVRGLQCSCTDEPFVLMENGEPIQAQEAMKRMVK